MACRNKFRSSRKHDWECTHQKRHDSRSVSITKRLRAVQEATLAQLEDVITESLLPSSQTIHLRDRISQRLGKIYS